MIRNISGFPNVKHYSKSYINNLFFCTQKYDLEK